MIHEALVAAALTAAMLLLFLGNWRTTSIIAVSIPLSIFSSIVALHMAGETINVMTLGGLALAVGILVDDATVTIENIERHLYMGSPLYTAILDGAGEIAVPAFVSTLCICIVFVPMFFLEGVARYLFVPMAEAVVFAMLASYVLSRTLVPTLALLLMGHRHRTAASRPGYAALTRTSTPASSGCARCTCICSATCSPAARASSPSSSVSAWRPAACICCWAATCFPRWTWARSSCTCARPPAPASRTPPSWPTRWTRKSARQSAGGPGRHHRQHRPALQRH
ncbi:Efflux pump membrane transporter BepE [Chromobacterium violaceum]|uniref:Efflux pump membrane transporter BepE n=1 Tax=Chromobacterium violaceum TaxID=536 RepID=A0A447TJN8_CHRVL|nr:Efflux pump membrane transporter BepE [Chromobacterium violaceum]